MRVHVVYGPEYTGDHIFRRWISHLPVDWRCSTKPDPQADVNYFFPYLEVVRHEKPRTGTAAFFSHLEDSKARVWETAEGKVGLRIVGSKLYVPGLEKCGKTQLIHPPLEDIFQVSDSYGPSIGTSGMVYKGGRKGEGLFKAAMEALPDQQFRAVGYGWPCGCTPVKHVDTPAFYHSLKVYLCTSLIEGFGAGPLEALACGVPVVLPREVGVYDELPDTPGIFRYAKGDEQEMLERLHEALEFEPDREALHAAISDLTVENWRQGHAKIFEELFAPTVMEEWKRAAEFGKKYWGNCVNVNTATEEAKQLAYAQAMGIGKHPTPELGATYFDAKNMSILDIGGGPSSLLLRCVNRGKGCTVVDPGTYPEWVLSRYKAAEIKYIQQMAERLTLPSGTLFDEVWIYNVLQHVLDPVKVIAIAKKLGKSIRVFEWIDIKPYEGHPHMITKDFLEEEFNATGLVIKAPWYGNRSAWAAYITVGESDKTAPADRPLAIPEEEPIEEMPEAIPSASPESGPTIEVISPKGEPDRTAPRLHLLGTAYAQTTKELCTDAFTQKVYKISRMLTKLGYDVVHYGLEGADVPCEHVDIVSMDTWRKCYGNISWEQNVGKSKPNDLANQTFNKNAIIEINKRKGPNDILLCSYGTDQRPIAQAVQIPLTCEFSIGYRGIFAPYKVFESYAWMHYNYGKFGIEIGKWYDAVIPNFFDPDDFHLGEKKDYFLYIGRVVRTKGIAIAAQVAQKMGVPLIVAGPGELMQIGLKPGIHAHPVGVVNPEERAKLMSEARAVFVPTHYIEPFGGVAVEAMFCGTPVITSDWGVFPESVVHGVTGFRCRNFADFMYAAHHIDEFDPDKIRQYAIDNYSMDRVGLMYKHYFDRLLDMTGKGWYTEHDDTDIDWLKRKLP
jgi:glycosyltransferase involved in cell wall biosynthesis